MTGRHPSPEAGFHGAIPGWVADSCGDGVRSAVPTRWGFRHETWIVRTASGEHRIVQRRSDGSDPTVAPHPAIREAVRTARLPVPEPRRIVLDGPDVVVVLPFVEGAVAADLLGRGRDAELVGRACGVVAARLTDVRTDDLPIARASAVLELDDTLPPGGFARLRERLDRYVREVAPRIDGASAVFAHGDLAPVNVLLRDNTVAAVLDLDRARTAHPFYDSAWFAWVVSAHHPELASATWNAYANAAGMAGLQARDMAWLWPLQLLERVREARTASERQRWIERLAAALDERALAAGP